MRKAELPFRLYGVLSRHIRGRWQKYWQHAHGLQDALLLALLGGADMGHLLVS